MQDDLNLTFSLRSRNSICLVDGYGSKVKVEKGHLEVHDGVGSHRRKRRFWKADPGIERVLILGHSGSVSFEAIRWLSDARIPFIHVDSDGRVLATSAIRSLNDAALRRSQALAHENHSGLAVSRFLLSLKVRGQMEVTMSLGGQHEPIGAELRRIDEANSFEELLTAESAAASVYWSQWETVTISFAKKDLARMPEYWLSFRRRSSPITSSPRLAANPINALFNYLYALLEAETSIGCLAVGLDPGMGIVHADQGSRNSLVLDIMEAIRPEVDAFVLRLLRERTFKGNDFFESRSGVCRILPPITHVLADSLPIWRKAVGPVVEHVTRLLKEGNSKPGRTPLTQWNRSRGRDHLRVRQTKSPSALSISGSCAECGVILESRSRFCPECSKERRAQSEEAFQKGANRFAGADLDPLHGGAAAIRRGNSIAQAWEERKGWDAEGQPADPEVFKREIWPSIRYLPINRLMNATGLSARYCQMIRKGHQVPHERHWEKFRSVGLTD